MSFQPIAPFGGLAGWAFLQRTSAAQQEALAQSAPVKRDTDYFRDNIASITSAEQLVEDPQLLRVALGAFGLQDDSQNKFFIQKVLSDGTLDDAALANKLSDSRYKELSEAFGFGDFDVPRTALSTFPDEIINAFEARSFEVAIGEADQNLRLAMTLERELTDLAARDVSDNTKWFNVLGNPPLREVFETAFNLPSGFANLDIDKQLETIKDYADRRLGSSEISQFTDPAQRERLTENFLLSAQLGQNSASGSGSIALTLLQSPATLRF
jgi:hypothetical protein